MAIQAADTGNLEEAQNIVIAKCLYTEEHNAPCVSLVTRLKLNKGQRAMTWPKVGQATASDLTDGVEIVDTQDIGLTSSELTSSEVGLMFTLTDKLVRQFNEDVFKIIGIQMGDAMARKKDEDIITLFSALNGGTPLGGDGKNMSLKNTAACIAWAQAKPIPRPYCIVHHPNALHAYFDSLAFTPASTYPIPEGYAEDLLRDWYWGKTSGPGGVPMFHDGNIDVVTGTTSGYGAIFGKLALGIVEQVAYNTESQRNAAKRATDVVVTSDYGCYELDDGYGAAIRYEVGTPSSSN